MNGDEIYFRLQEMADTLNEAEYPQCYAIIMEILSSDDNFVPSAVEIADRLFDADPRGPLPECVARFMEEAYLSVEDDEKASAMCNLGSLNYTGRIGKVNYTKAREYYTIASELGDRQATENLGYVYYYGRDTAVDYEKAFFYFLKGALDGHLNSLYKVGDMYRYGYFVSKDEKEAFHIYKHCLDMLDEEARPLVGGDIFLRMGDVFYEGIGTEKNLRYAMHFYHRAQMELIERIQKGDFYMKNGLRKAINREAEARKLLMDELNIDIV